MFLIVTVYALPVEVGENFECGDGDEGEVFGSDGCAWERRAWLAVLAGAWRMEHEAEEMEQEIAWAVLSEFDGCGVGGQVGARGGPGDGSDFDRDCFAHGEGAIGAVGRRVVDVFRADLWCVEGVGSGRMGEVVVGGFWMCARLCVSGWVFVVLGGGWWGSVGGAGGVGWCVLGCGGVPPVRWPCSAMVLRRLSCR